jgi:hypothetical protein
LRAGVIPISLHYSNVGSLFLMYDVTSSIQLSFT